MKKLKNLKERICALIAVAALLLTTVMPAVPVYAVDDPGTGSDTSDPVPVEEVKIDYTISVSDDDGALSGVLVNATSRSDSDIVNGTTGENGKVVLNLVKDETYDVELSKAGYDVLEFDCTPSDTATSSEKTMTFSDFTVSANPSSIDAFGTVTFSVNSPVDGVEYSWSVIGTDITPTRGTGTSISVTCNQAEQQVTATASAKSKTASATASVNKINIDSDSISISLNPASESETDVDAITATVGGLPEKATGNVSLKYMYNNQEKTATGTKTAGSTSVDLILNAVSGETFQGKLACTVTYEGDTNFNPVTKSTEAIYRRTLELKSDDKVTIGEGEDAQEQIGQEITYGECLDKKIGLVDSTLGDREISYEFAEGDTESSKIVKINNDGTIELNEKPGTAKVIVKAAQTDNYTAAELTYYIVVKPKEITVDLSENVTLDSASKVYDGKTDIALSGNIVSSELAKGKDGLSAQQDEVKIEGIAGTLWNNQQNKADASIASDSVKVTEESFANAKISSPWYSVTYENENVFTGYTQVNRRTLYLGTENQTYKYGQSDDIAGEVAKVQAVVRELERDGLEDKIEENGLAAGETLENAGIILPYVQVDMTKVTAEENLIAEGNYPNSIIPNITTVDQGNYTLKPVPESVQDYSSLMGDLTVTTPEEITLADVYEAIDIEGIESRIYRPSNDNIWVNGSDEGTEITFTIKAESDFAKFYDTVKVDFTDDNEDNLTDAANVNFQNDAVEVTEITGSIKFEKTIGGVVNDTNVVKEFTVHVDSQNPTFEFGAWSENQIVTDTWAQIITFNHYKNSYYSIEGIKHDDASGSSVENISYYVWGAHDNEEINTDDDITPEKVKQKISDEENPIQWENLGLDETSIPVIKEESGKIKELQGHYIVLVKVSDQVGNTSVYTSNGLIVEVQQPSISIGGIDSTEYYAGDVPYTVQVADNEGDAVVSGIQEIRIQVQNTIDGKTETPFDQTYPIGRGEEKDGYSLKEIEEIATERISETVIAEKNNSNDIRIIVTAYDQAGNQADQTEKTLMIDTTDPTIEISYDNNNAVNGKYFSSARTMTIKYTERNFEESRAVFDVTVDEKTGKSVRFDELGNFGITYKKVSDSQEERSASDRTDEREVVYELTFSEDADYQVIPHCTDLAGNANEGISDEGAAAPYEFTVDNTDPSVSVKYYVNGQEISVYDAETARVYSQDMITAVVSVDEHNFAYEDSFSDERDQMNLQVIAENALENVDTAAFSDRADERDGWVQNGDVYTKSFDFTQDANYELKITYEDLAGRTYIYNSHYFTVDDTNPTGSVAYDTNAGHEIWRTFFNLITFGRFSIDAVPVTFTGEDVTAGVASMEYYKAYAPMSYDEVTRITDWTPGTGFTVEPNEQFVPYLKVTDRAGNVEYFSSEFAVIADNTRPEITITEVNQSASRNGIYNEDVNLRIDVTDPTSGNTYSGLERIWYDVTASGNVSQSETITLMDNSDNRIQSHQGWSGNVTIPAQRYNSNDVRVQVHAVDFSGNQYDSEVLPLKIDVTEPTIQVTYDLNSPLNDRYYNATRTATVVVTDRNFDESAVRFDITNTDGTQPAISGWSHSSNSGVSDEATHTCSVTFSADGDYTFTLNVTDLAGNDSHYTQVDDFTIDQTDPTIQVSYDNNNDAESGYYNADRTATITVTEHNFNESEVNAQITARLQGSGVSVPGVGGWSTRGDVHTASVTFSADADYTFDIDYTDLAGNAAADYTEDSFTIDQTAPEVEFFDIEDKSANKDTVAPGVRYSDVNYTSGGVDITIEGAIHPAEDVDGTRSNIANGESIKMADFAHTEENDDVYTMTAVITDRAGNETEESIVFSVNRFGSTYEFSPETKAFLEDHDPEDDYTYTNDPQDIVVTERNVDTLVFNGISYGRDGTQTDLEEGSDYTVRESGSEVSWKEYMYNISRNNFEEEGHYILNIDSEDRAENSMNNKVKGLDIEFTVDKTVPTLVITGVEEDSYRADTRDMTVNVADNTAVKEVQVFVDGEVAQTYDRSQIEQMGGELTYTIQNANSPRIISAVAVDLAGNETTYSLDHEVLVTSNLLIQYVNNTPLVVGSIIAVIVIAGAAYYFLIIAKRRKKGQEK